MSSPFDRSLTGEVDGALGQDAAVSPQAGDEERVVESALRPHSLTRVHRPAQGRPAARRWCSRAPSAAAGRRTTCCCPGPPGLGKTSLALIIGSELGTSVKITSGPAIERSGDLAAMLSNLAPGDVLFIDEIHRIARPAEELLYMAMEDFRVDVVVGKGPGATAIPLEISPFTLVGATTRAGLLTGPLRDRFGFVGQMEFYEPGRAAAGAAPQRRPARRRADRRRLRGDRRPVPRHTAHRQPAAAPGPRLRRGRGRRPGDPRGRPGGAGALRRRRPRPGPAGPRRPRGAGRALRRRAGRRRDAGGRRRGGAQHGRGGLRAVPRARRPARPDPAGPGGDRGGLAAPRAPAAAGRRPARVGPVGRSVAGAGAPATPGASSEPLFGA